LEDTKYVHTSPCSPKLEGTRPTSIRVLVTPKVRVCPSLREPISGTTRSRTVHVRTLPNFCAIPWLVPPLAALRYLMYFRFTDDVIFVHNGPFGGVSITLQRATSLRRRTFAALYCMVASSLSCTDGGGHPDESIVPRQPGAEPAIYHCLVLLYPPPPLGGRSIAISVCVQSVRKHISTRSSAL